MNNEHIPVPSGHAPRLETHSSPAYHGIVITEKATDAFIHCENPVEVRQ